VEVLFHSVEGVMGANGMGVLLTGMGADGSQALLDVRNSGCYTLAQEEATRVVWGMPGVAVKLGAVDKVPPLDKIGPAILRQSYE
jgi:two-component system chemotaxis response regulator CheB